MCEWVLLCLRWLVDLIFIYGGLTDGIFLLHIAGHKKQTLLSIFFNLSNRQNFLRCYSLQYFALKSSQVTSHIKTGLATSVSKAYSASIITVKVLQI
jgi:hypothetical protein